MIIEIRKAGFVNKGAELMLRTIVQKLRERYPEALLTMATTTESGSQPFRRVVELGAYPKVWLRYKRVQWGRLARFVPRKVREMYGLVLDQEVDVVIDAAGFSYSDQWGAGSTLELAESTRQWRRQGTKVVLMPQAFGPYTGHRIRSAMAEALQNSDLVMPREETSHRHLEEVAGSSHKIRQYPDFTNLIEGVVPHYFDAHKHRVCLVPNYRMIDKTDSSTSTAYLPFMVHCAKRLKEVGEKPFVLVHEGQKDRWLAEQISEKAEGVPILIEDDTLKIKGIIGASYATIGSRFHGLVSALSQGVPALSTGWSHKYSELFKDYGFPQGVVAVDLEEGELNKRIDALIMEDANAKLKKRLLEKSAHLKNKSEEMWGDVFNIISEVE